MKPSESMSEQRKAFLTTARSSLLRLKAIISQISKMGKPLHSLPNHKSSVVSLAYQSSPPTTSNVSW
jgi:hypothetical protein